MTQTGPAEAGNTAEYGPSWTERIAEAARTVTSPAEARAAAERVIAEHHAEAAAREDEDYAAAIVDEALEAACIDWIRQHVADDHILEGDFPQQASAYLGREFARLLRAWGSPLDHARLSLTTAAVLRAAKAAVTEAANS